MVSFSSLAQRLGVTANGFKFGGPHFPIKFKALTIFRRRSLDCPAIEAEWTYSHRPNFYLM